MYLYIYIIIIIFINMHLNVLCVLGGVTEAGESQCSVTRSAGMCASQNTLSDVILGTDVQTGSKMNCQ